MQDGEGTYWKLFYAGIGFVSFGAFLMWFVDRDQDNDKRIKPISVSDKKFK